MPEVPAFDALMWPALTALKELGGSASNEELLSQVIASGRISDRVATIAHTDRRQTKLGYNLAWAKTYLKKAGAITNSQRGVWSLTDAGEALALSQIPQIVAAVRKARPERGRSAGGDNCAEPEDAGPEIATWRAELLDLMRAMLPAAFERLAQRLLREAGFVKVEVTGRSGDGGIDGVGVLRVNLLSFVTLFQCKRYSGTVGPATVRDFRGAMVGRSDKGIVLTTGSFSPEARREATRDGAPAIDLIDGERMCDLLKQLKLGVAVEMVEHTRVDRDWFAAL